MLRLVIILNVITSVNQQLSSKLIKGLKFYLYTVLIKECGSFKNVG